MSYASQQRAASTLHAKQTAELTDFLQELGLDYDTTFPDLIVVEVTPEQESRLAEFLNTRGYNSS